MLLLIGLSLAAVNIVFGSPPAYLYFLLLLALPGLVFLLYAKFLKAKLRRLRNAGKRFPAKKISLSPIRFPRFRGFHTFTVVVEIATAAETIRILKSHPFSSLKREGVVGQKDGELVFKKTPTVTVYADPNNLTDYIVDVKL